MANPNAKRLRLHHTQGIALQTQATEVLYGGAAGGGKSHLMRVAALSWCFAVPNLQVYLFRRLSDDLQKNHMEGETGLPSLLAGWLDSRLVKIRYTPTVIEFRNGAKIHLCHCQYEKDVTKYQGAEIHVLLIDELTHFTDMIYRYLRGRCRVGGLTVPDKYRGMFPRIICGSNPGGVGHNWVKSTFIDLAPPLAITEMPKKEGGMLRQFIPALLGDNPTMTANDPDYVDRLEGLGNEALVRAMKDGDWNIVSGGAFDDVWSDRCIVPRFKVPPSWRLNRSFDWGSSHPFAVAWWAEADGTEANIGEVKWCPPRGSLIMIGEWYGASGPNVGLKLSARDVAAGIVERETMMRTAGPIYPGPADNQIDNVSESGTPTIASEMAAKGVRWTASDKASGTRKIGLELMRQGIREAGKALPESAGIWFMDHCRAAIAQIPVLPRDERDPEDVDTKAEDHMYDAIRYRVLARAQRMVQLKVAGT
jgi:hypothetical protein